MEKLKEINLSAALCSRGDFHWSGNSSTVGFWRRPGKYLDFVNWKIECYIRPSYEYIGNTDVIQFLIDVFRVKKISIGLVHPMAFKHEKCIDPFTADMCRDLLYHPDVMACQPYIIAAYLLGVKLN